MKFSFCSLIYTAQLNTAGNSEFNSVSLGIPKIIYWKKTIIKFASKYQRLFCFQQNVILWY